MDWENVSIKNILTGHNDCVESVDFSNDSKFLVSTSYDKYCIVWNWKENKELVKFGHDEGVKSAYFSPDDEYIRFYIN